jgi:hypothetical protein
MLVYALFVNPVLTNPMTSSALDAASAVIETRRWQVAHADLSDDMDVALADSRKVAGPPPGLVIRLASVVVVPQALAR